MHGAKAERGCGGDSQSDGGGSVHLSAIGVSDGENESGFFTSSGLRSHVFQIRGG